MEIAEFQYDHQKSPHYRLLRNFAYKNPWHQKFLDAMVFNTPTEFHISFWKLKRIGEGIGHITTKKLSKVRQISEILKKHFLKEAMRAFWKIEHCNELDASGTDYSVSNMGTPLYSRIHSRNPSKNPISRNISANRKLPPKTPTKRSPDKRVE